MKATEAESSSRGVTLWLTDVFVVVGLTFSDEIIFLK